MTVYRLICKGTIEERILQRAREKSEIHRMVIQGGSFKGKGGDLKPKEVVSLLLDDEEIEQRVKIKLEEDEDTNEDYSNVKKAVKREASATSKENGFKKMKLEDNEESDGDVMVTDEDPKPLLDFAGDKMGPKKSKSRVGGKRGRPKGSGKTPGKEKHEKIKKNSNIVSLNQVGEEH